jgi:hypothetical protein
MDLDGLVVPVTTGSQRTIIRNLNCRFNVQSLGSKYDYKYAQFIKLV